MNYYTLSKKPVIHFPSNAEGTKEVTCFDLLAASPEQPNVEEFDFCVVTKYYIGRPDLISYIYYGTDIYGDVICKINGISNPFELNEGYTLVIPSIFRIQQYVQENTGCESNVLIKDSANDTISDDSKDKYKKLKTESRSPNELTVGQTNYVIDRSKNLIFY